MTQDSNEINQRLTAIETRLERLEGQFQEEAGFLLDGLRSLSAQTTNLANQLDRLGGRVDQLTTLMLQLAQNAETDRAETRRIWEYLESQQRSQGNGHG